MRPIRWSNPIIDLEFGGGQHDLVSPGAFGQVGKIAGYGLRVTDQVTGRHVHPTHLFAFDRRASWIETVSRFGPYADAHRLGDGLSRAPARAERHGIEH